MERTRNEGQPATIGHLRAIGLRALSASCLFSAGGCGRGGRVAFDVLDLPDETVFLTIPRRRRLVCRTCGTRSFDIMPDWIDHAAYGNGRRTVR